MQIRHRELEIDEGNPFSTCKLGRQKFAEILTEIVGMYPDGFVLAINNSWGTGKTTFVKMWLQLLRIKEYKCVYFNAWENDFDKDPLTAIVAELKNLTVTSTDKIYKSVVEKGAAIAKAVLPPALKTISKGILDIEAGQTAVENLTKAATDSFDSQIKGYIKRKESGREFRNRLEAFVKKTDSEKPIVFVIDELDRCRPDYAVEVLEQMKHFFTVPGIVFVLSIDKTHLAAAVRGFYGSDQINTDEYLRRFIDLEYSIPKPSFGEYCKYLYEFYSFDEFLSLKLAKDTLLFNQTKIFPNDVLGTMQECRADPSPNRKIFGQVRLILNSFPANNFVLPQCLFVLVFWAVLKPSFYLKLANGQLTPQEICDEYGKLFTAPDAQLNRFLTLAEARLLVLYSNEFHGSHLQLITEVSPGEWDTTLSSSLTQGNKKDFANAISNVYRDFDSRSVSLSHLTKKINLTEPLVFQ